MAQSKAKREAISLIVLDLKAKISKIEYAIFDEKRKVKAAAEQLSILKRERKMIFELVRKLEDGLLGPLGRWHPCCSQFGKHWPHCRIGGSGT